MSFGAVFAMAIGLAMDATAVAAARGLAAPVVRLRHVLTVAALFGGAQGTMPLLGWLIGNRVGVFVAAWDHWIVFVLLVGIGAKMLWEARATPVAVKIDAPGDAFGLRTLLVLALATSIDAFAVGITLPLLAVPLVPAIVTIAVTTAVLSGAGVIVGRRFGARLGRRLDAFGGLVLIGLGIKILVEHLGNGR